MDLNQYLEITGECITNREQLVEHFAKKIQFFVMDNYFNDGPSLDDLLNEFLTLSDQLTN